MRILLVSGRHDDTELVQQALIDDTSELITAYSHYDATYLLREDAFDVVIVPADLMDRRTGRPSVLLLQEHFPYLPVIVLNASADFSGILPPNMSPVDLTSVAIREAIENVQRDQARISPGDQLSAMLVSLGKSLTEVLDLEEVLHRVVVAARQLTSADEGVLMMPDDGPGVNLYLRAKVGVDDEVARTYSVKTNDELAVQVLETGVALSTEAVYDQQKGARLYVPVVLKGQNLGVLGMTMNRPGRAFGEKEEDILLNLSSYAAIAIANANAHEETLRRQQELETLVEVGQVMNSSLSLDMVLFNVCEQLVRVLAATGVEIYTLRDDQFVAMMRLRRAACPANGEIAWPLSAYSSDDRAALLRGEVIARREHHDILLPDYAVTICFIVALSTTEEYVLTFGYVSEHDFPGAEGVQREAEQLMVAARDVLHTCEDTSILLGLIDELCQFAGAAGGAILVLDRTSDMVRLHTIADGGVWLGSDENVLDVDEEIATVLETQKPLVAQREQISLALRAHLDGLRSEVSLILPIIQRGQTQGMILVSDMIHYRDFNPRDIDLATAITAQASAALENAELMHNLQRKVQQLHDAQNRLVQTARLTAMGELASAVAHQLNNPLTTIIADAELMLLDVPEASNVHQSLTAIARAGKRAASVARRLMAVVNPQKLEGMPQPVDVVRTIEDVLLLVRNYIETDAVRITEAFPEVELSPVWVAPDSLADVWLNLLMNARDALDGRVNPQISIVVAEQPAQSQILVKICDNGPGIPEDSLEKIFTPFYTTKPVGERTGLGLHICRQAVQGAGGEIFATNRPDGGACFTVRLPTTKKG